MTTPTRTKRTYDKDFKQQAVELSGRIGAKLAAVDLGIAPGLIRAWTRAAKTEGPDAFRGHGNLPAHEKELSDLRREISILKMEREILKKATEFWVKERQ
jgi:transposase